MSEGLMSRVKRLVSGSLNSFVDSIENAAPETVMQEAIRELETTINEVRDELGRAIANKHHASKRLIEANKKHEDLQEKIDFAVREERDDLAKAAIARQLDLEAQTPILETALKDATTQEQELEGYVAALLGRKREMEEDLATYKASQTSSDSTSHDGTIVGSATQKNSNAEHQAEKAQSAFDRALSGATGLTGTIKADHDTAAKLAELETAARENRIEERLASVKAMKSQS